MKAFCCHGNQTKRQITIILAILDCPYQSTICTKLESYCFSGFEVVVIKKIPFSKNECCHGNQTKWLLVIKHINWVDNHQKIISAKYGSHHFSGYGKNAIKLFSHYKSMKAFCCHGNQTKRQITIILAILDCPYQSTICTKLESYCFSGFEVVVIKKIPFSKNECCHGNQTKWPLVIKHINWVENHQMWL